MFECCLLLTFPSKAAHPGAVDPRGSGVVSAVGEESIGVLVCVIHASVAREDTPEVL